MSDPEAQAKRLKLLTEYVSALEKQLQAKQREILYIRQIYNCTAIEECNQIMDDYRKYRTQNIKQRQEINALRMQLRHFKNIQREKLRLLTQLETEKSIRAQMDGHYSCLLQINKKLYQKISQQNAQASMKDFQFDPQKFLLLPLNITEYTKTADLSSFNNQLKENTQQSTIHQSNSSQELIQPEQYSMTQAQTQNQGILLSIQANYAKLAQLNHQNNKLQAQIDQKKRQFMLLDNKCKVLLQEQLLTIQKQRKSNKQMQIVSQVSIKSQSAILNQEINHLMDKIKYLQEINDRSCKENEDLKDEIKKYRLDKDKVLKEYTERNQSINDKMSAERQENTYLLLKLRQNQLAGQQIINNYEAIIQNCKNELNRHKQQIIILDNSQLKLRMEIQSSKESQSTLNQEIRKLNDGQGRLRQQSSRFQGKQMAYKQEIKILKGQQLKLNQNLRSKQQQIKELAIKVNNLEKVAEENRGLMEKLQEERRKVRQIQQQLRQRRDLQSKMALTKEQLSDETSKHNLQESNDQQTIVYLNERIRYLQSQNMALQDSYNKISLSYMNDAKRNQQNQTKIQILTQNIQSFSKTVQEKINQKVLEMNTLIIKKDAAITVLQSSNSVLRKQVIRHLKNQEDIQMKRQQANFLSLKRSQYLKRVDSLRTKRQHNYPQRPMHIEKEFENQHPTCGNSQQNSFQLNLIQDNSKQKPLQSTSNGFSFMLEDQIFENEPIEYQITF